MNSMQTTQYMCFGKLYIWSEQAQLVVETYLHKHIYTLKKN